jgi:hypothetical protein
MFDLKLLKGHTNPDTSYNAVESVVIGVAQNFIADSEAKIGDYLIAVFDLDGEFKENKWLKIFDSTRSKDKSQLLKRLNTLLKVADGKMVDSSKDISGAGIIGTVAMLCESSKVGAKIDLEKIPRPKTVPLEDWLLTYPSFGFIFTTKEKDQCLTIFGKAGLVGDVIGTITKDRRIKVSLKEKRGVFIDLEKESIYNLLS